MMFSMMFPTEPSNIERFRIIVMMCMRFRDAADLAWLTNQFAGVNGITRCLASDELFWMQ